MRKPKHIRPSIKPAARTAAQMAFDFTVNLDVYDGPMDVLLMLARKQQVDVRAISITRLAEQYLQFIAQAQSLNLELAADYLVMASWLAYLKSRLLLPKPEALKDEPSPEEMAQELQMRLLRLDGIRRAVEVLQQKPVVGEAFFTNGHAAFEQQEEQAPDVIAEYSLYDLLKAYTTQCEKRFRPNYDVPVRNVWSLQESRETLESLLPELQAPTELHVVVDAHYMSQAKGRDECSAIASTLNAALEMRREGQLALTQAALFAPLYLQAEAG